MKELKLTINLLPKGAWGNDFSKTLSKKDWDTLRNKCYKKANNRCEICGYTPNEDGQLDAHEEWEFDIPSKKQTLKNIIALCSRCHGVKHYRNSNRLGYGDNAKEHFLKTNECSEIEFASHLMEAESLFEERNEVFRWKTISNLDNFGGIGITVEQRNIPMIKNPYESVDFNKANYDEIIKLFPSSTPKDYFGPPLVKSVQVDNYQSIIKVICLFTNKIDWSLNGELIKTKYNVVGKFKTEFKVEDLEGSELRCRLTGDGGTTYSQTFKLFNDKIDKEVL